MANVTKYEPLLNYLKECKQTTITLSYDEIEEIISSKLPVSAHNHRQWWENYPSAQGKAWLGANYKVESVLFSKSITFIRC